MVSFSRTGVSNVRAGGQQENSPAGGWDLTRGVGWIRLWGEMTGELGYLLRLIDDEDAREGVELALLEYLGDVSDELAGLGVSLSEREEENLSRLLRPGRELRLRDEWVVPEKGLNGFEGDWDRFEALLRVVADFLHDGVSLRPSLSDELDDLARELEGKSGTPLELAEALFGMGRFVGNQAGMSQVGKQRSNVVFDRGEKQSFGSGFDFSAGGSSFGLGSVRL